MRYTFAFDPPGTSISAVAICREDPKLGDNKMATVRSEPERR
ncbi:hypothetical protein [Candidatus Protofrankia californiensis]|nr:hypothetical protein [Candidatus Protofrankia californiensis]